METSPDRPQRRFVYVTLACYAALVGVLVCYHEPWRDEANPWLVARSLPPGELLHFTGSVGSPATWYWILAPFARLGAPYAAMGWIHAAVAIAAAGVFLRFAPFPRTVRLLAVFSYFMAYEYAVLARNYSLLALMLFATATLYARRNERPVVFALAVFGLFNTTAHGAFLAAVISAVIAWEWVRTRKFLPLAILGCGAIVAGIQLWPPADGQQTGFLQLRSPGAVVDILTRAIAIPIGPKVIDPLWLVINFTALVAVTACLSRQRATLALWLGGLAALFYIFAFKWVVAERHAGIVLLWLMFVVWIARRGGPEELHRWRRAMIAIGVALVPACVATAFAATCDLRHEYSHGRQMAMFIRSSDLDLGDRPIAATNLAESVLPYLRCCEFWSINTRRRHAHYRWDRAHNDNWFLLGGEVWRRVEEDFPDATHRPLVLSEWPLPYVREHGYELLYQTSGPVSRMTDERFWLYAPTSR